MTQTPDTTPGTEVELRRETTPVATADTDSWVRVIADTAKLAEYIAGTEFVPRDLRGKPAAVAAAILYGREVGLPPMTSLTQTHVIEGKPSTSAEGMRALVIAAGHELVVDEATGSMVKMSARRRGSERWTSLVWTIDMARAAGLLSKDNWKKYPRAMLTARCTDELVGMVFPDVIHGLTVRDVLLDMDDAPEPAASSTVKRDDPAPKKRATRKPRKPPEPVSHDNGGLPLPGEDGYAETPEKPADAAEQPPEPEVPGENGTPGEETDEENGSQPAPSSPPAVPSEPERGDEASPPTPPSPPRPISRPQSRMILAAIGKLAGEVQLPREERLRICRVLAGREVLESTNDLTRDEASSIIDALALVPSLEALYAVIDEQEQQGKP